MRHTADALVHYRRALTELEAIVGTTDARVAMPLMRIGVAELEMGHTEPAIEALDRAVAMFGAGAPAPFVADAKYYLAEALARAKREPSRARKLAEEARDLFAPDRHNRRRAEALIAKLSK